MTTSPTRINTLDALRGLAALAVCWFHLVHFNHWIPDGRLRTSGAYGWLGVEVFFVVSGFVIPYAMHRSGYGMRHFHVFIFKRLVRLTPPYYAAIAFVIALGYLSNVTPGFRGIPFHVSPQQLFLHLTYAVDILHANWLNYAFWTLAVEFQFYLLIGLLFSLVANPNVRVRLGMMLGLSLMVFVIPSGVFVFHYLFLFLLGILTFHFKAGIIERRAYWVYLVLLSCGLVFAMGVPATVVGVATALVIAFVTLKSRLLQFFGDISYSLYLLHMPIYPRVFNLTMRVVEGPFWPPPLAGPFARDNCCILVSVLQIYRDTFTTMVLQNSICWQFARCSRKSIVP